MNDHEARYYHLAPGHSDGDGCTFPCAPGHLVPVDRVAAALMPGASVHYGVHVVELGEDGEDYAVSGHVPERRAKAAVLSYLRKDCGLITSSLDRDQLLDVAHGGVDHAWAVATGDDDAPWEWCDAFTAGSHPVTVVTVL